MRAGTLMVPILLQRPSKIQVRPFFLFFFQSGNIYSHFGSKNLHKETQVFPLPRLKP